MTLNAALSKLDAPANGPTLMDMFAGFDDRMEEREPGYKARKAAERTEKERKRLARCKELLAQYGSEEAIFAETPVEVALREALAPLACKTRGFDTYRDYWSGKPTPAMWEAIESVCETPTTVQDALAEFMEWERLSNDRYTFDEYHEDGPHIRARQDMLEYLMDTLETPTCEGILARLDWLAHTQSLGHSRDSEKDEAWLASMRRDFEAFAATTKTKPDQKPATQAQRAALVRDLINSGESLSDREIARRAHVSPQTVGNWRRRMADKP
jgi:hypothetical protein